MDLVSSSPPRSPNSRNLKIRRVESLESTGFSAGCNISDEKSATAERKIFDEKSAPAEHDNSQSIQPQKTYEQQEAEDELANKLAYKEILFEQHPDILRIIKKIDRDGKELLLFNDRCKDSDIDTDDEEQFHVPTKSNWLRMCVEKWGVNDDDSLIRKVRAAEIVFEIFTAGYRNENGDSCCGAIIRDSHQRPIVGISQVIPDGKSVSPFCLELEGVALGVNLAKKYEAFPFYLYCPSQKVCDFVELYESEKNACYCSGARKVVKPPCEACPKRSTIPKGHEDYDKASEIVQDIFSDYEGHKGFNVIYGGSRGGSGTNKAAYSLAKRGISEEVKLKEIGEKLEHVWDAIYEEVFDQYVRLEG